MTYKEIISHEIACAVLEKDVTQSITTDQKTKDIADAINKLHQNDDGSTGFKADFDKPEQKKYRPFFVVDAAGFRFGGSRYGDADSSTTVGSRLCDYVGSPGLNTL